MQIIVFEQFYLFIKVLKEYDIKITYILYFINIMNLIEDEINVNLLSHDEIIKAVKLYRRSKEITHNWQKNNKEKCAQKMKRYYKKHRESLLEKQKNRNQKKKDNSSNSSSSSDNDNDDDNNSNILVIV